MDDDHDVHEVGLQTARGFITHGVAFPATKLRDFLHVGERLL